MAEYRMMVGGCVEGCLGGWVAAYRGWLDC